MCPNRTPSWCFESILADISTICPAHASRACCHSSPHHCSTLAWYHWRSGSAVHTPIDVCFDSSRFFPSARHPPLPLSAAVSFPNPTAMTFTSSFSATGHNPTCCALDASQSVDGLSRLIGSAGFSLESARIGTYASSARPLTLSYKLHGLGVFALRSQGRSSNGCGSRWWGRLCRA